MTKTKKKVKSTRGASKLAFSKVQNSIIKSFFKTYNIVTNDYDEVWAYSYLACEKIFPISFSIISRKAQKLVKRYRLALGLKSLSAEDFVDVGMSLLGIDGDDFKSEVLVFTRGISRGIPKTVAAASIYLACSQRKLDVPQAEICDLLGLTETALRMSIKSFKGGGD